MPFPAVRRNPPTLLVPANCPRPSAIVPNNSSDDVTGKAAQSIASVAVDEFKCRFKLSSKLLGLAS